MDERFAREFFEAPERMRAHERRWAERVAAKRAEIEPAWEEVLRLVDKSTRGVTFMDAEGRRIDPDDVRPTRP